MGRRQGWRRVCGALLAVSILGLLPASASANDRSEELTAGFSQYTRLGEGGSLSVGVFFSGSEYYGQVAPLTGLTLRLPQGIGLHSAGFPTCSAETVREWGPIKCPAGSQAGPIGSARLAVPFGTFGEELFGEATLEEQAEVFTFLAPDGGLVLYLSAHFPVSVEILIEGHYESDIPPYGDKLVLTIPTVSTTPFAPDVSITALEVTLGAVSEVEGHEAWNLTLPSECSGSTTWAAEASFNGEASEPFDETFGAACPPSSTRTPTTTTVTTTDATPAEEEPVTFTATVTPSSGPAPTGTVEFTAGDRACTAQPLIASGGSSTATCQVRYSDPGGNEVRAYYDGSETNTPSLSHPITVEVRRGTEEPPAEETPTPHEEPHSSGTTTTISTTTSSGPLSTTSTLASTSSSSPSVTRTTLLATLRTVLTPPRTASTSTALLRHGGLTEHVSAPEAGTLSVQWLYRPKGGKAAEVKPVIVAAGKLSFAIAGAGKLVLRLTRAGKRLLRRDQRLKLTARATFVPVGQAPVRVSKDVVLRGSGRGRRHGHATAATLRQPFWLQKHCRIAVPTEIGTHNSITRRRDGVSLHGVKTKEPVDGYPEPAVEYTWHLSKRDRFCGIVGSESGYPVVATSLIPDAANRRGGHYADWSVNNHDQLGRYTKFTVYAKPATSLTKASGSFDPKHSPAWLQKHCSIAVPVNVFAGYDTGSKFGVTVRGRKIDGNTADNTSPYAIVKYAWHITDGDRFCGIEGDWGGFSRSLMPTSQTARGGEYVDHSFGKSLHGNYLSRFVVYAKRR
jgi:Bacterial Ig-like domain (group 3)